MSLSKIERLGALCGLSFAAASAAYGLYLLAKGRRRSSDWEAVLDKVLPAIVVLKVNFTKHFDTEQATCTTGTGFVVDKERGIILTNRHLVTTGPVRAEAVFMNKEEVELLPLYRDPVHDFAFYRFDPQALKYLELTEIPLAPHAAKVGADVSAALRAPCRTRRSRPLTPASRPFPPAFMFYLHPGRSESSATTRARSCRF